MTSTGPRAVNCTSCGAGQNVLGGGRVKVHVCDFCGAAMDASENFEVLAQFSKAQDLGSPFVPGMTGQIDGIDWTVIGTLQRSERWHGSVDTWYEHQLYSDTHGYAWLSVEDGHLVFSRRMRGETRPKFMTYDRIETMENRPSVRIMDNWTAYGELDVPLSKRMFKYHESGHYRTDQAAGSFTWMPKVGEVDATVTFVRESEALHFTESATGEREIMLSRYLPAIETYDSFAVADEDRPYPHIHVLEPYLGWVHESFVKRIVGFCVLACLLLGLFLLFGPKDHLGSSQGPVALRDLPVTVPFETTGDGRLVQLELIAYPENGWAGFEIEIRGPDGETVGWHEVGIERYSGRDSDGAWTEGGPSAWVTVRPAQAGVHQAIVSYIGFEPWSGGRARSEPASLEVRARAKRGTARWPLIGAGLFALLFVVVRLPAASHKSRRNKLSDWVDEEDDD